VRNSIAYCVLRNRPGHDWPLARVRLRNTQYAIAG